MHLTNADHGWFVRTMKMIATPEQIIAARGLLRWSQEKLAKTAVVARTTLMRIEGGQENINSKANEKIQSALERNGIVFLPETDDVGDGVRFAKPKALRSEEQGA